jgi:hypothetical protein
MFCEPGSSVSISTGYGLYGPGIESRWGRDFSPTSRPTLGPTQPPVQWVPGLSRGVVLTTYPLLAPMLRMSRAIPLLPPLGPWWPVIGWTSPFYHTIQYKINAFVWYGNGRCQLHYWTVGIKIYFTKTNDSVSTLCEMWLWSNSKSFQRSTSLMDLFHLHTMPFRVVAIGSCTPLRILQAS